MKTKYAHEIIASYLNVGDLAILSKRARHLEEGVGKQKVSPAYAFGDEKDFKRLYTCPNKSQILGVTPEGYVWKKVAVCPETHRTIYRTELKAIYTAKTEVDRVAYHYATLKGWSSIYVEAAKDDVIANSLRDAIASLGIIHVGSY